MTAESNLDRTTTPARTEHTHTTKARSAVRDLEPGSAGSPRARRRTRQYILRVSLGIVVLGVAFLVVSLVIGATVAPPVVVMVAGVLGALLSGVLRRASASDRATGHTTE